MSRALGKFFGCFICPFMICSIINTATINEVTISILRVITVEPSQYGDYVCKASNKVGSAEARINLFGEWKFRSRFTAFQTHV